ncbi:MAG: DMT family transporter [Actinomycetota bacterium]|nr:DMT family transporter [Actinomycetota bacterium]
MAGTLLLAPAALAITVRGGFHVNARQALAVVLLGVLGTGIVYVISYRLIADVGPTRAAAVTYLIPIVAVTVASCSSTSPSPIASSWAVCSPSPALPFSAAARWSRPIRCPRRTQNRR